MLGDESLCASCRRNLTQWRDSRPTNEKYFRLANSRGKRCLNKVLIAGQNRELALFRRNSSEFSPLFRLLENVFLGDCLSCLLRYLEAQTNQLAKHATTQTNFTCETFCGNDCWNVIFPKKLSDKWVLKLFQLAYNRLFHMSKLSMERHRTQMPCDFVNKLNAKGRKAIHKPHSKPNAVGNNSGNWNSIFHSSGMWRGGAMYRRLTRQWSYLHRWFLKKYLSQIHFSYYFFLLLLEIAKICHIMI